MYVCECVRVVQTHKVVKLFKCQLALDTRSTHPPSFQRSSSVNSVNRDCPQESASREYYRKQLSNFVFALLSRENKE